MKRYGEQASPEQRAERQRTVLSRFSDWTRPRWAGLHNHLDVKRLVDQGLLETRTVVLTVGGKPATEYRLTPAGAEAVKEGQQEPQAACVGGKDGHREVETSTPAEHLERGHSVDAVA